MQTRLLLQGEIAPRESKGEVRDGTRAQEREEEVGGCGTPAVHIPHLLREELGRRHRRVRRQPYGLLQRQRYQVANLRTREDKGGPAGQVVAAGREAGPRVRVVAAARGRGRGRICCEPERSTGEV